MAGSLSVGPVVAEISLRELLWSWFLSLLLFLGGNDLLTIAEKTVDSGIASVLIATTPLFMALLETMSPWGDRLTPRVGWVGVLAGLVGVGFLTLPKIGPSPAAHRELWGFLIVLGSSASWSVGSFLQRHRRIKASSAGHGDLSDDPGRRQRARAVQFSPSGEGQHVGAESLTPTAIWAFCHLLVVGSLIGYVAYVWLLGHVSTTVAGTYAYVNPVVALLVGQLAGEKNFTWPIVTGMLVILAGVAGWYDSAAWRHPLPSTNLNPEKAASEPRRECRGEDADL